MEKVARELGAKAVMIPEPWKDMRHFLTDASPEFIAGFVTRCGEN
jgi:hypothetical protein